MPNVIKQIVNEGEYGAQTIKMIVRANERGPQGAKGEQGPQGPQGIPGPRGFDGAIQYRAGTGIKITDDNIIEATGESTAAWGGIQGDIQNQTDLQNEFGQYTKTADLATVATTGDYNDLTDKPTIPTVNDATLTIQSDGTTVGTFTANSSTNVTANVIPPVRVGSVVSQPTNVAFVDTVNIVDGAVTGAKLDYSTLGFGNYSLNEQDTGFTWINGAKIYKKTINFGNLPNNGWKAVNHNITGLAQVVKIEGAVHNTDSADNEYYPLPLMFRGLDSSYNTQTTVTNTDVAMSTTMDRSMFTAYVTIYYTKSS